MVKRILNKYGYPPDLQEEAVKTVLAQAEQLCADWVGWRDRHPGRKRRKSTRNTVSIGLRFPFWSKISACNRRMALRP